MTHSLRARFDAVMERLDRAAEKSGRPAVSVGLTAVSKFHGAEAAAELVRHWAQRRDIAERPVRLGESYAQEAAPKFAALAAMAPPLPAFERHFIGRLQSNKAKEVCGKYDLLHSLDSEKLGLALQRAFERLEQAPRGPAEPAPAPQAALVQINIGREPQKAGVMPEDAENLLLSLAALPGLRVDGLMCLPPDLENAEAARPFFAALRVLRDDLRQKTGLALPHLSMGMSHDFEAAVAEGATLVRIGTDIFGPRVG